MPMLEDFRLKVFMAVVHERSFTKAASVLGITQPSVSQNIADLEKMTGRKLFDRQKGAVACDIVDHLRSPFSNIYILYNIRM